jgi:hypothetical protein
MASSARWLAMALIDRDRELRAMAVLLSQTELSTATINMDEQGLCHGLYHENLPARL